MLVIIGFTALAAGLITIGLIINVIDSVNQRKQARLSSFIAGR